ncbi:hypothetical protein B7463_g10452, partial [Scytalidium lignicola]
MATLGIVLGVLPLLISALEHYDDVLRPFKRYRNFDVELKRFKDDLYSEQAIFHAESMLLLTQVTSPEIAAAMVKQYDHPSWKDAKLENDLSKSLGTLCDACTNVITSIKDDLQRIKDDSQFFSTVPLEATPVDTTNKAAWRSRIGKKLKWCLSHSQLQIRLDDLRRHVETFQRLSSQINKLKEKDDANKLDEIQSTVKSIEESGLIQKATTELYQALIVACKTHPEHTLHFRLETRRYKNTDQNFVRFHFASIQSILRSDSSLIWIAIESEFGNPAIVFNSDGREKVEDSVQMFRTQLKRTMDSTDHGISNRKPTMMEAAIVSPSWNSPPPLRLGSDICADRKNGSRSHCLPDFCQQHDLCNYITNLSKGTYNSSDACVGYLKRAYPWSHRVFIPSPIPNQPKESTSLAKLISSIANHSHSGCFLYVNSIRLAKQLASAILSYHATPMLSETWQSEDIIFYSNMPSGFKEECMKLDDPYLAVHIASMPTDYPQAVNIRMQKKKNIPDADIEAARKRDTAIR